MPTKSSKRLWTWIICVIGLLALAVVTLPAFFGIQECGPSPYSKELANLKQVALACILYSQDNEGRFPKILHELFPDYLPAGHADEMLSFVNPETIPKKPWYYPWSDFEWYRAARQRATRQPWCYATGLSDKTPKEWFLLWSPEPVRGKRICARCDASGSVMREEDFRAEMKRQGRERELEKPAVSTK